MNNLRPKFYTPKYNNLGNALNKNNMQPQQQRYNALMAVLNQDLGGSGTSTTGVSDAAENDTMSVESMTPGQMYSGMEHAEMASNLPGLPGTLAGLTAFGLDKSLDQALADIGVDRGEFEAGMKSKTLADGIDAAVADPTGAGTATAAQNMAEQNRAVSGTDQGISRNDPNPAPSGDPGDGQGDTVICTELHRQGYLSDEVYEADKKFGGTLDIEVLYGYHRWAIPWVKVMKASPLATRLTWLVARPWSQHMAFKMGVGKKDSFIGRQVMRFGLPLCRLCNRHRKRHLRLSASK